MGFAISAEGDKILGKKLIKRWMEGDVECKKTLIRHQWDCGGGRDRKITPGCATRRSLGPSLLSLLHTEQKERLKEVF